MIELEIQDDWMPAAGWGPLMARLPGFRLHALDLPGFGLADPLPLADGGLRREAVRFLEATMDRLELERASFVASSMGALWSLWFALDRPERVASVTAAGCPALIAGTSAPLPMRMVSLRPLGRLLMKMQRASGEKVEGSLAKIGVDVSALPEMRDLIVALQRPSLARPGVDRAPACRAPAAPRAPVSRADDRRAETDRPTGTVDLGRRRPVRFPSGGRDWPRARSLKRNCT